MKRRLFIKGCTTLLGSTLISDVMAHTWRPAELVTLRTQREGSRDGLEGEGPVIVGLGSEGSQAVTRVNQATYLPNDLSCYTLQQSPSETGITRAYHPSAPLFNDNLSALLVFAPNNPWALNQALELAEQMQHQDVYIKAAVTLASPTAHNPVLDLLSTKLDALIYLPTPWDNQLEPSYQPLVQTLRLFFSEPGLVCVDPADIKTTLSGSAYGIAHTINYLPEIQGGKHNEVARKHVRAKSTGNTKRVIAMMQDGPNMTVADFDDISLGIKDALGTTENLVITNINLDFSPGDAHIVTIALV